MGAFDFITCKYPLPVPGMESVSFQTKDFGTPFMDHYEIRDDGTLWYQEYDTEDHSDKNATGFMRLVGMAVRVNKRWVHCKEFTGEIVFYPDTIDIDQEFSAYFVKGCLRHLEVLK